MVGLQRWDGSADSGTVSLKIPYLSIRTLDSTDKRIVAIPELSHELTSYGGHTIHTQEISNIQPSGLWNDSNLKSETASRPRPIVGLSHVNDVGLVTHHTIEQSNCD